MSKDAITFILAKEKIHYIHQRYYYNKTTIKIGAIILKEKPVKITINSFK